LTFGPNTNGLACVPLPVVATDTEIGGALVGVTLLLAAVYGPVPIAFTAATLTVYAVPFVSPVSEYEDAALPVFTVDAAPPLGVNSTT
jgi:hypothetical protein